MSTTWQRFRSTMTRGGWTAALLSVLAVSVLGPFVYRFVRVWLLPAPSAFSPPEGGEDRARSFAAAFDPFVKQLNGRSMFYVPSPPGSEGEAPVEEVIVEENGETPTRYDGPSITAIVLDTVWFNDGKRLRAGGEGEGGLKVLSTQGPWGARVVWRGAEFTVPFFERDKVIMRSSTTPRAVAEEVAADVSVPQVPTPVPTTQPSPTPAPTPTAPPPPPAPEPAPAEPTPDPMVEPTPDPTPPDEPQAPARHTPSPSDTESR